MPVFDIKDLGQQIHEATLKKGLRELNPWLHFDMGAALNIHHPRIGEWQGVFYKGKNVSSMDRGSLPEYNVYAVKKVPEFKDGEITHRVVRDRVLRIGWRTTLERLIRQNVPGITQETVCVKFGIDYKWFRDGATELWEN
jgi:hypothetical protein